MNYLVFWPNEAEMEKAGFGYICEVPAIFDENWRYQREASCYLRDRAKGEAFDIDAELRAFPARSSIGQYAYKLVDFLAWCDWVKRDWREVEYHRDLVCRYQQHMLKGDWAAERGQRLSPSTVNGRVDEAVWFCGWAAKRGLRGPFKVQTRTTHRKVGGIRSDSYKLATIQTRTGKVRPKPIHLSIPTPASVEEWLRRFAVERGETKALMAELVIRTALRREEAAQWRIEYLPLDHGKWKVMGDYVSVLVEHGTKGNKPRYIDMPIDLAERLVRYRDVVRPKSRMLYVRGAQGVTEQRRRMAEKEPRLFLSDHTGTPITGKKLYEAWHEVSHPPVTGWSTHLGRHYWTCKTLLERHQERTKMLAEGAMVTPDWATALARDDILMFVKPQLGHVDSRTSEAYTVWLGKMLRSATETGEWIESLEINGPNNQEKP
jgi:integrase